MKRDSIVSPALVLILVLAFSGIAMAGEPGPGLCVLPDKPTSGPFLYGTFTAARDQSTCSETYPSDCGHYNFHLVLTYKHKVHLFSTPAILKDLCNYVASNPDDPDHPGLKELGAKIPCILEVGEAFGLTGVPVIYNLYITERDFCGTEHEMIHGLITIRVVPVTLPPHKPPHR
jgi:hypothetical protein